MRVILKLFIIRAYNYPMSYNDDEVDTTTLYGDILSSLDATLIPSPS